MALAPVEIYYSQQVRPYTMLQFIALAAAIILISIEKRGWSWAKMILLSMSVLMLALTHYFCAGVIAAIRGLFDHSLSRRQTIGGFLSDCHRRG